MTINFYHNRQNKTDKKKLYPISVKLYHKGEPKFFNLDIKLKISQWDEINSRVKNHPNARNINKVLGDKVDLLNNYVNECVINEDVISLEDAKSIILGIGNRNCLISFCQNEYNIEKKKTESGRDTAKAESTLKKYIGLINTLKDYQKTIPFGTVNYTFLKKFKQWLETQGDKRYKHEFKPLSDAYINRVMSDLKTFVNEAYKRDKIKGKNPFDLFENLKYVPNRNNLTGEEIKSLENCIIETMRTPTGRKRSQKQIENLRYRRDIFLFMCYTGASYVDFFKMTNEDIIKQGDLVIMTGNRQKNKKKTQMKFQVPISVLFDGKALQILEKYNKSKIGAAKIFPKVDPSVLNNNIREMAKHCGIKRYIRVKDSRDTFVELCRESGIHDDLIAKFIAHTSLRMTSNYGSENVSNIGELTLMALGRTGY